MNYTNHEENLREVGEYVLRRTDPYGFWIIRKKQGATPKVLEGESFTSTSLALKFLQNFMAKAEVKKKDK